jgi:hypothetical protein
MGRESTDTVETVASSDATNGPTDLAAPPETRSGAGCGGQRSDGAALSPVEPGEVVVVVTKRSGAFRARAYGRGGAWGRLLFTTIHRENLDARAAAQGWKIVAAPPTRKELIDWPSDIPLPKGVARITKTGSWRCVKWIDGRQRSKTDRDPAVILTFLASLQPPKPRERKPRVQKPRERTPRRPSIRRPRAATGPVLVPERRMSPEELADFKSRAGARLLHEDIRCSRRPEPQLRSEHIAARLALPLAVVRRAMSERVIPRGGTWRQVRHALLTRIDRGEMPLGLTRDDLD